MPRPKLKIGNEETDALRRSNTRLRADIAAADGRLLTIHNLAGKLTEAHRAGDLQGLGRLLQELERTAYFQVF